MPWIGIGEVRAALKKVAAEADVTAREIVSTSASVVQKAAQANFEGSHKKGMPHVGGDKPNVVTGALRRSIRPDPVTRIGLGSYVTLIGPRTVYGRRVELGMNGSRAYPYFHPAVEATRDELSAAAAKIWRTHLF